jgi:nitrite reductase (cytochrome c-552)
VASVVGFALATVLVLMLLQNIFTRKREAEMVVFKLVDLDEGTVDPSLWGKNFPRQYDAYLRTVDMERTKHGGSEAIETGSPGSAARSRSKLEMDPRLVTIFAGYPFSVDYRERRGHAYMLSDQDMTERVKQFKQPGTCLHCHASVVAAYRQAGRAAGVPDDPHGPFQWPQVMKGFELINPMPYAEARQLVSHAVACIDCHDPGTMQLRATRPGFMTGIASLARSDAPVPHLPSVERWRTGDRREDYDPNTEASRQEMRSFVCAQCHVEYYFRGPEKLLVYPWHEGLRAGQIESYYDQAALHGGGPYKDFTHKISGAAVLKAQHPEFETWSQGIHARSGVACADCHMPYVREGAIKISDHHVRSPLLNISHACQVCHRFPEEELRARAEAIQDRTLELLNRAEDATVDLIHAIERAAAVGATEEQLRGARDLQRKAQWRTDFVNAENSMGFHAPQETAKNLAEAIDYARQGQVEVAKLIGAMQRPGGP